MSFELYPNYYRASMYQHKYEFYKSKNNSIQLCGTNMQQETFKSKSIYILKSYTLVTVLTCLDMCQLNLITLNMHIMYVCMCLLYTCEPLHLKLSKMWTGKQNFSKTNLYSESGEELNDWEEIELSLSRFSFSLSSYS